MADIRSKVIERSKQNAISRAFHAKNDTQTIASWRLGLDRILLIFNVRSVVSAWPALTVNPQTELGLNVYVTVSDVREGVTKTYAAVSEVQCDVADTRAMVSDIHRNILAQSQEGADNQDRSVSNTRALFTTKYMLIFAHNQNRSATPTVDGPGSI